jgi:hypothetical protein
MSAGGKRQGDEHMTEAPQRKHCEHEVVCERFINKSHVAMIDGTLCMANYKGCKQCQFDTRSRPHTPALTGNFQEWLESVACGEEFSARVFQIMSKAYTAGSEQAARTATLAENKRVLDAVDEKANSESETAELPCQDGWHTGEYPEEVIRVSYLEKILESLRQHDAMPAVPPCACGGRCNK